MIKKEQLVQDSNYICLNPHCPDSLNRIFCNENRHYNSSQCRKWIVQKKQLVSQNWQLYTLKSLYNLNIDFDNSPIEAAKTLQKLSVSDWKKLLSCEQSRMKKQVCNSIQIEFQTLKIKIEELITKSTFVNDLKQLISKVIQPTDLINQYYKNTFIAFQFMQNHILFKKSTLKECLKNIKSQIEKIYWQMMEQKSQINKLLTYQQQRQYHQYIFETTDNYFNKLQILAASLNTKMTAYTIQNQKISLECLMCNKKMHSKIDPVNKKNAKKYLAQQILIHLYCQHYQEVGFAYSRKIKKADIVAVTFQLFLQESQHFKTIKLIDRQSGPGFEYSYNFYKNNPDTYILQILSLKNIHMTKGKHLLVSVHQSIDMMIAIISYICTRRGQNVEIQSKKELLKNGLTQILDLKVEQKKVKKIKIEVEE